MAPARLWFLAILDAARSSTTTTDLVLARIVGNLCSLSKGTFVIRYHIFWRLRRALRRFLLPLAFLVRAFWACLSCHSTAPARPLEGCAIAHCRRVDDAPVDTGYRAVVD